ncbi:MAG: DUF4336 domain-containing protein [Myxococcota bacterium]
MLERLADDLFTVKRPQKFLGIDIGTRMTVVRLADAALWLHSPVPLDADLRRAVEEIGTPRFAVAPNRFHHLHVGDWASAWPDLEIHAAPGLESKRPDLAIAATLGDEAPEAWRGRIDQRPVRGADLMSEVVFLHRDSRTLILTDLAFNVGDEAAPSARLLFRMMGRLGRFGPSFLEKLIIRDRAAASEDFEHILGWDFDRVLVTHGEVLESGGRAALREGYAWLLD